MKRRITLIGVLLLLMSPALGGKKTGGNWTVTLELGICGTQVEPEYLSGFNTETAGRACSSGWSFGVQTWGTGCVASYWLDGEDGNPGGGDDIELTQVSLGFKQDRGTGALVEMMGYFQTGAPGTHIKDRERYEAETAIAFDPPLDFDCNRPASGFTVNLPADSDTMVVVPSKGPRIPVGVVRVRSITFEPN